MRRQPRHLDDYEVEGGGTVSSPPLLVGRVTVVHTPQRLPGGRGRRARPSPSVRVLGESQECLDRIGEFIGSRGLPRREVQGEAVEEVGAGQGEQEDQGQEEGQGLGLTAARTGQVAEEEELVPRVDNDDEVDAGQVEQQEQGQEEEQ